MNKKDMGEGLLRIGRWRSDCWPKIENCGSRIKCPSDPMDATERLTKETTHLYGRYKEASRVAIHHGKEPGPRQETNLSLSLGRYTCPALLDGGTGKSWKDAARDWWLTRDKTDNWRSLV